MYNYECGRLIVGAPRGNYTSFTKQKLLYPMEPGVVYRCTITYNKTCEEIKPRNIETEKAYIAQYKIHVLIKKQYGWFGGAVSIDRSNGILTVSTIIFFTLSRVRFN